MECWEAHFDSAFVAGRHLMPPSSAGKNKYPTKKAKGFLQCLSDVGLGTVTQTKRNSIQFRKRSFTEINEKFKQKLVLAGLTKETFDHIKIPCITDPASSNENVDWSDSNPTKITKCYPVVELW